MREIAFGVANCGFELDEDNVTRDSEYSSNTKEIDKEHNQNRIDSSMKNRRVHEAFVYNIKKNCEKEIKENGTQVGGVVIVIDNGRVEVLELDADTDDSSKDEIEKNKFYVFVWDSSNDNINLEAGVNVHEIPKRYMKDAEPIANIKCDQALRGGQKETKSDRERDNNVCYNFVGPLYRSAIEKTHNEICRRHSVCETGRSSRTLEKGDIDSNA